MIPSDSPLQPDELRCTNGLEVDMQFDNLGDDEDLQNKDDDEQDDDQEKMHSAENMDIISELQMKQQ